MLKAAPPYNGSMKLRLLPLVLALASLAAAQTPVEITAEPHHHLLLENGDVRVFALTLRPQEQAMVNHQHNFLLVSLTDGELVIWAEGSSSLPNFRIYKGETQFSFAGRAIGMRNDRTTEYQGVVVEFLNPKVTSLQYDYESGGWEYNSTGINPPADPHARFVQKLELGAASAADVQLMAGDSYPPPEKPSAELLIPVSEIELALDQRPQIHKLAGEAAWIPVGRKSELANRTNQPARFIMVTLFAAP